LEKIQDQCGGVKRVGKPFEYAMFKANRIAQDAKSTIL